MSNITIQLDRDTYAALVQAATAQGVQPSVWVQDTIKQLLGQTWPAECLALAGRFTDFSFRTANDQTAST